VFPAESFMEFNTLILKVVKAVRIDDGVNEKVLFEFDELKVEDI
jgi:hypothetical protein